MLESIKNWFKNDSIFLNKTGKISILLLRLAIGWLFFYSGITKVINPGWTATEFLSGAQTFSGIYNWFASSSNIGWVDFFNSWGQLLIGLGLIAGAFTRLAAGFGILLMILYYFPVLNFPYVKNGFLIDTHIIYILIFVTLIIFRAGKYWGVDQYINKKIEKWWL